MSKTVWVAMAFALFIVIVAVGSGDWAVIVAAFAVGVAYVLASKLADRLGLRLGATRPQRLVSSGVLVATFFGAAFLMPWFVAMCVAAASSIAVQYAQAVLTQRAETRS